MEKSQNPRERLDTVLADFATLGSWPLRYQYIMDLGSEVPRLPAGDCTAETLFTACSTPVWIKASRQNEAVLFQGNATSALPLGLLGLLISIAQGAKPDEIVPVFQKLPHELDLEKNLSPVRYRAFLAMIDRLIDLAKEACSEQ